MRERSSSADLLKGIAVLLMIQVHVVELFASNTISESSSGKILLFLGGPPVAPLFLAVMGYYIAASTKNKMLLIKRGLLLIFSGMLLNVGLNFNLIWHVLNGKLNIELMPYLLGADILHLAGLSTVLMAFFKNLFHRFFILIPVCILLFALPGELLINNFNPGVPLRYLSSFFFGSTTWSYFPLFPWFAYALAGFGFHELNKKFNLNFLSTTLFKSLLLVLFALFLFFTLPYAVGLASQLQQYYHHTIVFTLWLLLFLSFYQFTVKEIDEYLGSTNLFLYLKWLGENVTLVFIVQWLIIGNTATVIFKSIDSGLYLALSFILVLLATSGITLMLLKIKPKPIQ